MRRRSAVDDEVAGLEPLAGAQQDRALQDVLELAAIARPGMADQPVERCRGREGEGRGRRAVAQQHRGGDGGDIAAALAQRLQGHRHDVEPPVEIGAEAAGGDFGGEIAVGQAMTRRSTASGRTAPTGRISFSCSARSNLA